MIANVFERFLLVLLTYKVRRRTTLFSIPTSACDANLIKQIISSDTELFRIVSESASMQNCRSLQISCVILIFFFALLPTLLYLDSTGVFKLP